MLYAKVDDEGWCMTLAAVVCFIVRWHRRRVFHSEVSTAKMNATSEDEIVRHLADVAGSGRTEKHKVDLPRALLGGENFAQEPPPAYIPRRRGMPWQCDKMMQGMSGECRRFPESSTAKTSLQSQESAGPLVSETRAVSHHAMEIT